MKLADIVGGIWALTPAMHAEVQRIYAAHMRGDKIDLADVEARIGKPLNNSRHPVDMRDGVAVISADGVLAKRANLFMDISGGTSMQILADQIRAATADPNVRGIVLALDSPGGTVDGTQDVANAVRSARGKKPIVAVADGLCCSAAYWIASAADRVLVASDTTVVGSIGVVATHKDVSGAEAKEGVKTTEITAGKYKRIASQHAPLSDEGKDHIQARVDYLYSIFVDAVAENRGVSVEAVLQNMADGREFIGRQAIAAGLVDGVSTVEAAVARIVSGEFAASGAGVAPVASNPTEDNMDVAKLKTEFPAVAEALLEEGRAAERARIQAVEAAALPGHEALIESLKFDGKTSGGDAALAVNKAERAKRGQRREDLRADAADAAKPAATVPAPAATTGEPEGATIEDKAKHTWERDAAVRAEFGTLGAYTAFRKNEASVKINTGRGKQ